MGRTLVVRAFLLCTLIFSFGHASADEPQIGTQTPVTATTWEDLESWLRQLCFVVNCDADRPALSAELLWPDWTAVHFILSYQVNGVRQDLSLAERDYARAVSLRATKILTDNPGRLDAEVEEALYQALWAMRCDIDK